MRTRLLCFILALGLIAVACGSSDTTSVASGDETAQDQSEASGEAAADESKADTSDADSSESDSPDETDRADEDNRDNADTGEEEARRPDASAVESDSPIENLLGVPVFDQVAMNNYFANLSREAEVVIATCMLAEGFEYTPNIVEVQSQGDYASDTLEYAQERGLGIVAEFNDAEYDPATAPPNPNAEYIATLSEGERSAYYFALSGAEPDVEVFESGGCQKVAEEEIFEIIGVFDTIGPTLETYYDLFISDPRVIATTAQWQECMAEEGFVFENEDEMFESVFGQLEPIFFDPTNFADVDQDAFVSTSAFGSGIRPPLVPEAQATVDAIGEEEILIAVANWTCREPIKDAELEVQREYEVQFVAEVAPQVQAIRGDG